MIEKFDFEVDDKPAKPTRRLPSFVDVLTVLVLLVALLIGAFMFYIFINPQTPLNPLYPNIPTPFRFPTATVTPIQMEPTWTPTFVDATITPTLAPTFTLQPSATVISLVPPSRTPSPSPTAGPPYSANISAVESTIIHADSDCNWLGVGGSVVDADNTPVLYMTLRLSGKLNDEPVEKLTVSGTALDYGPAGFEFKLGTTPVDSNSLRLQLLDQSGIPQADDVAIVTHKDCSKNLILVRFKKNP
jgi:hypothetical protein